MLTLGTMKRIVMKHVIWVVALFFFSLCCYGKRGNYYYFEGLDVKDGLSQNTVYAILQDKTGFMWFGTKDGLNRYDGSSFRKFKHDASDPHSLGCNYVMALCEDDEGNIWVGTDMGLYIYDPQMETFEYFQKISREKTRIINAVPLIKKDKDGLVWIAVERQGVFCYNPKDGSLKNYTLEEFPFIRSTVTCLVHDNGGRLWVGTYGNGLFYTDDGFKTLHPYVAADGREPFANDIIAEMAMGAYNCLYVASVGNGVKELDLASGRVHDLLLVDEHGERIWSRELLSFSDNELWIGTESGLYIYNLRTREFVHQESSAYDPYSLSDNAIYSLYKDSEKGVWIGTYFGGVNYYPRSYACFEKYYPKSDESSLHGRRVREFCPDGMGNLWIGTEDGGLNCFDMRTGRIDFFTPSLAFTNVHGLCMVGNELWVGTFTKGLKVIDPRAKRLIRSYGYDAASRGLNDNNVFAIFKTRAGEVFVGTSAGLQHYDKSTDSFINVPELAGKFVYDIKEDAGGNLWLATYVDGAFRYDVVQKKWKNFRYIDSDARSLSANKVLSIFEDSRKNVWLTTQGGGVCRYHPDSLDFTRYDTRCGLPNDVVYQIVEDAEGLFWMTTNSGLVHFDPVGEKVVKVYTMDDGLLSNQFNYRSGFKERDGTIYFGSIDGFIAFNPATFSEDTHVPCAVITDFLLFNEAMRPGKDNSPLQESITCTKRILLTSEQHSFAFRVASLDYQASKSNKLKYKLEGFDSGWHAVGENPLVSYSNLPHGEYVFHLKASDENKAEGPGDVRLEICILPPFYFSAWAYGLYAILFVSFSLCLYLYVRNRSRKKRQRQHEKFEQEKEKEVYDAKFDFFINVAHEIRTPLTLIKGPLENIILRRDVDAETREDLNIMKQNTERLLTLTNQLLDFHRAESKVYNLNFTECNVTEIVRSTYLRFTSLAKQKGLDFTLHLPPDELHAHVNKEAFTKILSNLLSNGVKYADTRLSISLDVDVPPGECFYVRTVNDGPVVPDAMKEDIFRPFMRFDRGDAKVVAGTGIGLALSRSLAELHRGSLMMEKGTDNVFCLSLPLVQQNAIVMDSEYVPSGVAENVLLKNEKENGKTGRKYTILVVDDHAGMLSFIAHHLSEEYVVLTAANGAEALHILDKHVVNLIVSDVVMPVMDGFELCQVVKSQLDYSHIPIVLLTAKTNVQSKIEGLEQGADAYIEKPFSLEYLRATVSNLIRNREQLRQTFAQSPFVAANTMALTKSDEEFIRRLNDVILSNLHNPEFSMENMAEMLNMSRSNFYRKMKGVLDLTPNEYLRIERLKRAAQLLSEGKNRVTEICYMVGFNSPSYFSKCFLKQFGVLPKDFGNRDDTDKT